MQEKVHNISVNPEISDRYTNGATVSPVEEEAFVSMTERIPVGLDAYTCKHITQSVGLKLPLNASAAIRRALTSSCFVVS